MQQHQQHQHQHQHQQVHPAPKDVTASSSPRVKPQSRRAPLIRRTSSKSVAPCPRLDNYLPAEEDPLHVIIVRVRHRLANGNTLEELVLGGAQPQNQGRAGPVRRLASPYRGTSFHSCTQKWRARIKHGSKSAHLGYYRSDLEAAKAYNAAARTIHGPNAQVNEGVEDVSNGVAVVRSDVLEMTRVAFSSEEAAQPARPATNSNRKKAPNGKALPASASATSAHCAQFVAEGLMEPLKTEPTCVLPASAFNDEAMPWAYPSAMPPTQPPTPAHDAPPLSMSSLVSGWEDFFVHYWFDGPSSEEASFGPSSVELDASRCLKRVDGFSSQSSPGMEAKRVRC